MSRLVMALLLELSACSGAPREPPAPEEPNACSLEGLRRFDPGSAVTERRALPAMEQQLGHQTTLVAEIACAADEGDDGCARRAEAALASERPGAKYHATIVADEQELHARLRVDGAIVEGRFEDQDALKRHLATIVAAGREVDIEAVEVVAVAGSPRRAVTLAESPPRRDARRLIRLSLRLAPSSDPLRALLRLQKNASEGGIQLLQWSGRDDGSIDVEIACAVPVEQASP